MSIERLIDYLPKKSVPYLKKWFGTHAIHLYIARNRHSKLGDYRKNKNQSHKITLNSTLSPELMFFVLTHELAHLIAFEKYGFRISPHGKEWKHTFSSILEDSMEVYEPKLQTILKKIMKSPKANFMASEDLVRYFQTKPVHENEVLIEQLNEQDVFIFRQQKYKMLFKRKKNYLCKHLKSGREYLFKPIVQVEKVKYNNEE